MVADDSINYLRKLIMFYSKEDWILIHNLHGLKGYGAKNLTTEFPQKE